MSDSRKLRLEFVLQAVDRVTKPLRTMLGSNNELARAIKGTKDQLKELNRAQANIDSFRKLNKDAAITGNQLQAVQRRTRELAQQMSQVAQPTAAMTRAFEAAKREAHALKQRQGELQQNTQAVRNRLTDMGISTQALAQHQRELRQQLAGANEQLAAQQQRLATVAAQQRRVDAARQHAGRIQATAGRLAVAGAGATAAGLAVGRPLYTGLGEAKHDALESTRLRALGLGEQVSQDAIKFAAGMKTYGTSTVENLALMRDALSVFADEHHAEMVTPTLAKMKFSSAAVFGAEDGAENERKFMDMLKVIEMRGGLSSETAFREQADMVQRVITATGGRVGPDEWLNLIKTGGIAAKGIDDKAFYYQLEPLVQEMGGNRVGTAMMSAYANVYQGKTTKRAAQNLDALGLIADPSKVMHDKAGQISQLGVGALAGSELFRHNQFEWMEKILLPKLTEKGITEKNQVLDTIGGIFSNRTAANLFSQMYLQRDQIHKNAGLNAKADGIDGLYERAKGMPQGKELETMAKVHDLQRELGLKIMPLYARALEMATGAAERLTHFMQEHPGLAKAMAVAVGVLAASLLVLGPLLLAIASVLGPYAMLHILLAKIGVSGGVLSVVMRGLAGSFNLVMMVVGTLGRLLLLNPIGLAVTAIGVAAYLLVKYWEPIKGFFTGLWAEVTGAFRGGLGGILALIANWSLYGAIYNVVAPVLRWFGFDLPARFSEFGGNLLQGLISGMTGRLAAVRDTVTSIGDSVVGWFKERLGIHSPSRVFAQLGAFTMSGLEKGLSDSEGGPLEVVGRVVKAMAGVGFGLAVGTGPAAAGPAIDNRPPLTPPARTAASAAVQAPAPVTINIYPPAGADERAIARVVSAELQRVESQRNARARSRLTDLEE
ncbi:phage tail tape measure protein [Cupriavidus pinatubonensis]|uniref:phage tail tape measure protein n=1 Tax=Cupriavidus pinatubonensis TaxID=248026 RepID=UPI00360CD031